MQRPSVEGLETVGAVITKAPFGGPERRTYYTPAGEEIKAIPAIREWVRRDENGKVIQNGKRDANLDKGWLTEPPAVKQFYCKGCDKWHPTERAVLVCIDKSKQDVEALTARALKEVETENTAIEGRVDKLEAGLSRIEALLQKLVKEG